MLTQINTEGLHLEIGIILIVYNYSIRYHINRNAVIYWIVYSSHIIKSFDTLKYNSWIDISTVNKHINKYIDD